jgi:SAM-dependent methyltransferase
VSAPRRPFPVALKSVARQAYETGARLYLTPILRREAGTSLTTNINEGSLAQATALLALTEAAAREVLDVGTGLVSWPQFLTDCGFHVTAIDRYSKSDYWGFRPFNRHFLVQEDDITNPRLRRQFDAVTCMHVLMAIEDNDAAVAGMFSLVKPGGLIILSFPYNELRSVPNVYALPEAGYGQNFRFPCRVYCRADIDRWLRDNPAELVLQERYRVWTGELWTMGERVPPRKVSAEEPHHFSTVVIRKLS